MKPMRRALSLLLLPLVLLAAGCRQDSGEIPLKVRKETYRKVASLSPSTSEILSMPFGVTLVGRGEYDNYPQNVLTSVPVVAGVKPDYEMLGKIAPDLVVYDAALFNAQDQEKLKALGLRSFKIDANTVQDFRTQVFELASLLGQESRASDYVDKLDIELNNAKGTPITPTPKVAILMPSTSGNTMIAGTDSFIADVVRQDGGEPVGPKGSEFVPVNPEALISFNPDKIIVNGTKDDHAGYDAFMKDPRYQVLRAVKGNEVTVLDSDIMLRRGARVDQLIKGVYRAISSK